MKPLRLRQKHPRLIYQDFEVKPDGKNLLISFNFLLEPNIRFRPEISIPVPAIMQESPDLRQETPEKIKNLVFHLGMVEAISYWKAACPPELVIKAGYLSPDQIAWWKHLFIHGLGEFFYRNKIDFTVPDFLTIVSQPSSRAKGRQMSRSVTIPKIATSSRPEVRTPRNDGNGDLILVGGGKDSIVTLETLKQLSGRRIAMMVNPGPNSLSAAAQAGYKNPIIVTRIIDSRLLQLNKLGYLNGHTPFSAYLAFLGVFVGYLYGYKNVISSNELGAGEASLIYKSMEINHQYSKSLAFEKNFRDYCRNYLFTKQESHYFSFLRPLYELQIARIFANLPSSRATPTQGRGSVAISPGLPRPPARFAARRAGEAGRYALRNDDNNGKYDSVFVSCNAGRGKSWCGLCPKCGFSYLSLFPFMSADRLKNIFGRDLFEVPNIQKHILDLVGLGRYKPFDCVGTKEESILAAVLAVRKINRQQAAGSRQQDFLLSLEQRLNLGDQRINQEFPDLSRETPGLKVKKLEEKIMTNWDNQNFLPSEYSKLLKKQININY